MRFARFTLAALVLLAALSRIACAADAPLFVPQFLGAQYTFVDQHQDALRAPYSGPLSLLAGGDTEQSHTFGAYFGVQLPAHLQFYFDLEMFKGEGVSGATGLAGLTNGDVIRSGAVQLGKRPYVARRYLQWTRWVVPRKRSRAPRTSCRARRRHARSSSSWARWPPTTTSTTTATPTPRARSS